MEWMQCNIYYLWSKQCPSPLFVLSGSMFLLHTGYITQFLSRTFTPLNSTHPEEGSESRSSVVSQQEDLRSQLGHLQKYNFSFYKTYLIVSAEMEGVEEGGMRAAVQNACFLFLTGQNKCGRRGQSILG